VFVITVAFFILGIVSALFVKNINIKPPKKEGDEEKGKKGKKGKKSKTVEEDELEGQTATPSIAAAEKKEESEVEAQGEVARAEGV
jgi:hypothetical protein